MAAKIPDVEKGNEMPSSVEKDESGMASESAVELEDRDPNNLNEHLQILWDDVIAEPEGIRSPECAWRLTKHCFRLSKGFCYILLSVVIAPIFALLLGIIFACFAFQNVWIYTPSLRLWKILCHVTRQFVTMFLYAVVRPIVETIGYMCYNIRIMNQKLPDGPDRKDEISTV